MKTKLMTTTLLAAILVAACAPSAATPTAVIQSATKPASTQVDGDTTVLRFAVSGMGESQYSSLIESFQAENPGVYIKTVSIETTLGGDRPGAGWPEDAFLLLASAADVIGATATRAAVQQGAVSSIDEKRDPKGAPTCAASVSGPAGVSACDKAPFRACRPAQTRRVRAPMARGVGARRPCEQRLRPPWRPRPGLVFGPGLGINFRGRPAEAHAAR